MAISKVIFGGDTLIDLTADTVTADQILKGKTAHGADGEVITGTCTYDANTQDATATAAEILSGKTAYNKAVKLTGSMKNNGSVSGTISTASGLYKIPQGYHDGAGQVGIDATEASKLKPTNIRQGVSILGVTGTMSSTEGLKAQAVEVTSFAKGMNQIIMPTAAAGYNAISQVTVKPIPYVEIDNSAGGTTVTIG